MTTETPRAGTAEYMRLVQQNCPDQFLDFFTRDNVSMGENQAFEEFLFGMPHEDLVQLRARMQQDAVGSISKEQVAHHVSKKSVDSLIVF